LLTAIPDELSDRSGDGLVDVHGAESRREAKVVNGRHSAKIVKVA
jgi:hypothetical protein